MVKELLGATLDGIIDEGHLLESAVGSLPAGSTLTIPHGYLLIKNPITLKNNGVRIYGENGACILLARNDDSNRPTLTLEGNDIALQIAIHCGYDSPEQVEQAKESFRKNGIKLRE